ncbi:hypothetical protein LCGC14_1022170 [marine sediment metagenome]|uniref:Uncharacterized protein n=1 Tax=marine sediment metagenome TaxID=412755 RepID=A0A0F9MX77_9ZZZZ
MTTDRDLPNCGQDALDADRRLRRRDAVNNIYPGMWHGETDDADEQRTWDRWHDLLDIRDSRGLTADERLEYEGLRAIVEREDDAMERDGQRILARRLAEAYKGMGFTPLRDVYEEDDDDSNPFAA